MPPHHHGYADEYYWEDLPESAKKAATLLGYNESTWDNSEQVIYHNKKFEDLSMDEKRAATYLGRNTLDYKLKSVKWNTVSDKTQKLALTLGWTEETWNRNFPLHDVDCNEYWWSELSDEQKQAAEYFGFNQNLWDETENEENFDHATPSGSTGSVPSSSAAGATASSSNEEKKDDDDDDEKKKKKTKKKPVPFSQSPAFGGSGGTEFDHGNHMHIDEITVAADANMIHGIDVKYRGGGKDFKDGSIGKDNTKTFKLRPGEYITSIKVTTSSRNAVTSLTFFTNRGGKLGPCGEEKGKEEMIKAPDGAALCGFHGRAGRHINAIGFKWGPNPKA